MPERMPSILQIFRNMDFKTFLNYFKAGIEIANKNLRLFLIGFILSEYFLLGTILPRELPLSRLFIFLLVFPNIGFSLTLPLFLTRSQKGEKDTFSYFLSETLSSLKRSFLQLILILFLTGIILTVFLYSLVSLAKVLNISYTTLINANLQGITIGYSFFVLLSTLISILFSYIAIFFSLEKDSLISAVKKGVRVLRTYPRFTIWIFCLSIIASLIINIATFYLPFRDIFYSLISTYISFIITATILTFYKKQIEGKL